MKCQGIAWAADAGLPDWGRCENQATHTLYYIPEYLRAEVLAAHTTRGYVERYLVCDECAQTIADMCEDNGEWGVWLALDDLPEPFDN